MPNPFRVTLSALLAAGVGIAAFGQPPPAQPAPDQQESQQEIQDRLADRAHRIAAESETAGEKARRAIAAAGRLPRDEAVPPVGRLVRRTLVDEVLGEQQEALGIPHAPPSSDAAFLRRATLDATGLIPSPEAVRAFLADDSPDKRARLVDELVGSQEFAEQWAWFFGDLFRLAHQVAPSGTRSRAGSRNGSRPTGPTTTWCATCSPESPRRTAASRRWPSWRARIRPRAGS